jgi:hypothetical protein
MHLKTIPTLCLLLLAWSVTKIQANSEGSVGSVDSENSENSELWLQQPPVEISKTFIEFRKAEDEGDWNRIKELYSDDCKIVFLGIQETTAFGNPQRIAELTKTQFQELIESKVLKATPQREEIADVTGAPQNTQPTEIEQPTITYDRLKFSPLDNDPPDKITFEVRGLRKRQLQNQKKEANITANTALTPASYEQFYMEITKEPEGTTITHHAWGPNPEEEIDIEMLDNLKDTTLKDSIISALVKAEDTEQLSASEGDEKSYDKLEFLRIKNVQSLSQILDFLTSQAQKEATEIEVLERKTSKTTPYLLEPNESQLSILLTIESSKPNRKKFMLRCFQIIMPENTPKQALLIKYQRGIKSINGLIADKYELEEEIGESKLTFSKFDQESIEEKLNNN